MTAHPGWQAPPASDHDHANLLDGLRERRAARILLLDPLDRVLLLHYRFADGALAGQQCWATPGGALEGNENFQQAAARELEEETGLRVAINGDPAFERRFAMTLPCGERVAAHEQFFIVRAPAFTPNAAACTAHERACMIGHHWWSANALATTQETIWPKHLAGWLAQCATSSP